MWARLESNTIVEILMRPKALTIGDINYPSNIFSMWTEAELAVIGIVPVTMNTTNFKNKEYYTNTDVTYSYDVSSGKATGAYGTATARAIADTLYTAQNVTDDVYPDGHAKAGQRMGTWSEGDIKTYGLKHYHKENINSQAGGNLSPTDWMVVRATEGGTAVPSSITTQRAAVRTKANSMCTQIDNAANVDALAALYVYNDADPAVRPIGELPTVG